MTLEGARRSDSPTTTARTVNLGNGRIVPYPEPTSAAATAIGVANRRIDTKLEVQLRSALHRRGLRFRKEFPVRAGTIRVRPDVVFTRRRIAVFADGCFWHGCAEHQRIPRSNEAYWVEKLQVNVERDRRVDAALAAEGWTVVRIWEHEPIDEAIARVERAVASSPRR